AAAQCGALSAAHGPREHRVLRPPARSRRETAASARRCAGRAPRARRDRGPQGEGLLAGRAHEGRARSRDGACAAARAARRADGRARRDGDERAPRLAARAARRRMLRALVESRDAGDRGARRRDRDHRERQDRRARHARSALRAVSGTEPRGDRRRGGEEHLAVSVVGTVFRKEVLDNARDRRTLFSAFLFGPLLGPVLFTVLVNVLVSQTVATVDRPIHVPIVGAELAPNLVAHLSARGVQNIADHGIDKLDEAIDAVEQGRYDAVLMIDADVPERFKRGETARVTLVHDQSRNRSSSRVARIRNAVSGYAQQLGALKLLANGVDPSAVQTITFDQLDVSTPAGRSAVLLGMLTYFLLVATLMGGFYLAIDSTAGERERRSLEPLLTVPVKRSSLVLGKMAATTAYMLAALALTLTGFTVA